MGKSGVCLVSHSTFFDQLSFMCISHTIFKPKNIYINNQETNNNKNKRFRNVDSQEERGVVDSYVFTAINSSQSTKEYALLHILKKVTVY